MNRTVAAALIAASVLLLPPGAARAEFRTIDGSGNNLSNPSWGAANTPLVRLRDVVHDPLPGFDPAPLAPAYEDGVDAPRGVTGPVTPPGVAPSRLPNPRDISNTVSAQGSRSFLNPLGASDWVWQWGQFIDHDIALEEPRPTSDPLLIPVNDPDDSLYNPAFPYIPFRRNDPAPGTGAGTGVPREQVNALTAYIDGSNVYGSDPARADFLRTLSGGKLKTTVGVNGETLLPFNRAVDPFPNANPPVRPGDTPPPPEELFLAGDVRANEQLGLTAVHTLFLREHNRMADELLGRDGIDQLALDAGYNPADPAELDEYAYQMTRRAVGAQIQAITYNEFLPMLVGHGALPAYSGYDESVNATLSNEFANAAYRVGHTLLSPQIQLVGMEGESLGSVALRETYFNPDLAIENGVDSALKGLTMQMAQDVDAFVIDEVREFLFAEGNGGLDLAAVNLQRGRDHGLPSYNDMRRGLGLEPRTSFDQITTDEGVAHALEAAYGGEIEDVDLWIGAVSEDAHGDGLVGELLHEIIVDQFTRSRDGDRFFYLGDEELLEVFPDIGQTSLSQIVMRNTNLNWMPHEAFVAVPEPATVLLVGLVSLAAPLVRRGARWVSPH